MFAFDEVGLHVSGASTKARVRSALPNVGADRLFDRHRLSPNHTNISPLR
jgi:hypothetical protein